jgi:hypothetical protein
VVSHPTATSQGGAGPRPRLPPFVGADRVPAWFMSVLRKNAAMQQKGVSIQSSMGCLQSRQESLKSELQKSDMKVMRTQQMWCPCKLPQTKYIHSSNGTYFAWDTTDEGTVYVKCAGCTERATVPGITLTPSGWLPLTEANLLEIETKALPSSSSSGVHVYSPPINVLSLCPPTSMCSLVSPHVNVLSCVTPRQCALLCKSNNQCAVIV